MAQVSVLQPTANNGLMAKHTPLCRHPSAARGTTTPAKYVK